MCIVFGNERFLKGGGSSGKFGFAAFCCFGTTDAATTCPYLAWFVADLAHSGTFVMLAEIADSASFSAAIADSATFAAALADFAALVAAVWVLVAVLMEW